MENFTPQNDLVFQILQNSMQQVLNADGGNCTAATDHTGGEQYTTSNQIQQAIQILQILAHRANTYDPNHSSIDLQNDVEKSNLVDSKQMQDEKEQICTLADTARMASYSMHQLVHRLRSHKGKSGKKQKTGGREWKAVGLVVESSLNPSTLPASNPGSTCDVLRQSRAIAILAMATTLSLQPPTIDGKNSSDQDVRTFSSDPITKMVSSALLTDVSKHVYENSLGGGLYKLQKLSYIDAFVYKLSRLVVLDLLRQFVKQSPSNIAKEASHIVDIQVVNKAAHGFHVGEQRGRESEDIELQETIAEIVDVIFGKRIRDEETGTVDGKEVVSKDCDAAVLALVASVRPWKVVSLVNAKRLVSIAAEYDLFFAAESLCDAAIESLDHTLDTQQDDSVAHSTARAIIDAALGYRNYRRADHFASKYYSYGGPERYAEARYLHACDTISKLIKRRVIPLIDKQVERVDTAVSKVRKDLESPLAIPTDSNGLSDATTIDTMSENVREFTLRRLRARNMNSEALRLAKLWNMAYEHDPVKMLEEEKQRKLTYLQWDEEGCPGHIRGNLDDTPSPAPQLISEPNALVDQFSVLYDNNDEKTIGFDAEWGDDGPGVSLLQLSSTSNTLLLDIPALTSTSEGCDALRITVGQLFSGSFDIKYLVGFSCKEDYSRLRASSSIPGNEGSKHWFPSHTKLKARDLRQIIAETSPKLGRGSRGSPLGLSAACELYLGKALDKSEQCSDWSARPLTLEQLEYAALDAWACAAIHVKIASSHKILPAP